eukprot:GHVS01011538.1.p1 GENE.GHVS01011538.1~~GHVS01011538.1.p1  ORF type:complete len:838 (+),score=148.49 GHVS01011538.1:233-2746(+)
MWFSERLPFPLVLCLLAVCCYFYHTLLTSFLIQHEVPNVGLKTSTTTPLNYPETFTTLSAPTTATTETSQTVQSNFPYSRQLHASPSTPASEATTVSSDGLSVEPTQQQQFAPTLSALSPSPNFFPSLPPSPFSCSSSDPCEKPIGFFDLILRPPIRPMTDITSFSYLPSSIIFDSTLPFFVDTTHVCYLQSLPSTATTTTSTTSVPLVHPAFYQTILSVFHSIFNVVPASSATTATAGLDELKTSSGTDDIFSVAHVGDSVDNTRRRQNHRIPPSSLLPSFGVSFLNDFRDDTDHQPIILPTTHPLLPPPQDETTTTIIPSATLLPYLEHQPIITPRVSESSLVIPVAPHQHTDPTTTTTLWSDTSPSFSDIPSLTSTNHLAVLSSHSHNSHSPPSHNSIASAVTPLPSSPRSSSTAGGSASNRSFIFFNKSSSHDSATSTPSSTPPPSIPTSPGSTGGRGDGQAVITDTMLKECLDFCSSFRGSQAVNTNTWEILHTSPTCSVWRRRSSPSGSGHGYEYVARGRFDDISVEAYNMTVSDLGFRQTWDRHVVDIRVVDTYGVTGRAADTDMLHRGPMRAVDDLERTTAEKTKKKKGWSSWWFGGKGGGEQQQDVIGGNGISTSSTLGNSNISNSSTTTPSSSSTDRSDALPPPAVVTASHWFPPVNAPSAGIVAPRYRIVPERTPFEEVIYWRFRIPFPLIQDRDFVYARRFGNFVDDKNGKQHGGGDGSSHVSLSGIVSMQLSTPHKVCPEKKGECVRIKEFRNGLALFPLPGKTIFDKGMEYVLYHCDDPRSKLPNRVKGYLAATTLPVSLRDLHKAAKKLHDDGTLPSSSSQG